MNRLISIIFEASIIVILFSCTENNALSYMGQNPPGNKAELFAPGIVSLNDRNESMISFTPDGKECFFTEHHKAWHWCKVLQTVQTDTGWTAQQKAAFSNDYTMCPSISSDGKELFIASSRDSSMSVFKCDRTENGWGEVQTLCSEISSDSYEYSCHPSSKGSMFVCSWRSGAVGGCDGWRIPKVNDKYQKAENLGLLNSIVGDCVWAPGPNEEYLIFQSRRPAVGNLGGFFETDLYITFAMPDNSWSEPQNLGPEINSDSTDAFAWVSHDGKYLFFSSNRLGSYDIYWASLDSIVANTPRLPLVARNHKPGESKFYQKYDNVNDSKTCIYFDLEQMANVTLTVFDRDNSNPRVILNELRNEGENHFIWEGTGFVKGEYLCELQIKDEESTKIVRQSTIQILLR